MSRPSTLRFEDDAASPPRRITHRTRGQTHGPITRLMSPGDLGQVVKPFVFLDHFDLGVAPLGEMGMHPHSGIATVTFLFEGSVRYEDTGGQRGVLRAGGLEWFKAARGAWHAGGADGDAKARGFQLWVALPAAEELAEVESRYREPGTINAVGPALRLLGADDASAIRPPAPLTYLAVRLRKGETWTFAPPAGQTLAWCAVSRGALRAPEPIGQGELVVFSDGNEPIVFHADADCEFVVGAGAPHPHDLALGRYSVHTSPETLRAGERRIVEVRDELLALGRL